MELKPCPFCGKTDNLDVSIHQARRYGKYDAAIYCRRCCAYGPKVRSEEIALPLVEREYRPKPTFKERMRIAALDAWNRRVNDV